MSKTKRCNHKTTRFDWGRDASGAEVAIAHWCLGCGERLGLGPSNDEPARVQREMRDAAQIADGVVMGCDEADFWDEEGSSLLFGDSPTDWSWDHSRPIAEQLAETARDDAAADFIATQLAIDQSSADAMEYEATRSAEPDCRDEDDVPTLVASPEVCSCHGDALNSDKCRDFDPFDVIIPGDFGGPHGDIP